MRSNRIITIILSIYIVGIISSFFLVKPTVLGQSNEGITAFRIIKTFSANYWYLFVMWILGLSAIGFFINLFIVYFRGFLYGVLIINLLKVNLTHLVVITVLEIIIFLPLFIYLAYTSFLISFSSVMGTKNNIKKYDKLLIIITAVTFIYSILLEIVGELYG